MARWTRYFPEVELVIGMPCWGHKIQGCCNDCASCCQESRKADWSVHAAYDCTLRAERSSFVLTYLRVCVTLLLWRAGGPLYKIFISTFDYKIFVSLIENLTTHLTAQFYCFKKISGPVRRALPIKGKAALNTYEGLDAPSVRASVFINDPDNLVVPHHRLQTKKSTQLSQ